MGSWGFPDSEKKRNNPKGSRWYNNSSIKAAVEVWKRSNGEFHKIFVAATTENEIIQEYINYAQGFKPLWEACPYWFLKGKLAVVEIKPSNVRREKNRRQAIDEIANAPILYTVDLPEDFVETIFLAKNQRKRSL